MLSKTLLALAMSFPLFAYTQAPAEPKTKGIPKQPPTLRIAPRGTPADMVFTLDFATNRDVLPLDVGEDRSTFFTKTPTSKLKYGTVVIKLQGGKHARGKLEDVVSITSRRREKRDFVLKAADNQTDKVLVYIHGYNNDFDTAIKQTAFLLQDVVIPHGFIAYSWTSGGTPVEYLTDRWAIKDNSGALADFIEQIVKARPDGQVDFLLHSMGNDVFLNAIGKLHESNRLKSLKLGKVIFAAPDVAQDFFESMVPNVIAQSRKVVHYHSSKDQALALSKRVNFFKGARAGAVEKNIRDLETINVDEVNGEDYRYQHSYYASSKEVMNDIAAILNDENGKLSPSERRPGGAEVVRSSDGFEQWILKPDPK